MSDLAAEAERDEIRRAGCGLLALASKYTEESERPTLRVVR